MNGCLGTTVKFHIFLQKNHWPFGYTHFSRILTYMGNVENIFKDSKIYENGENIFTNSEIHKKGENIFKDPTIYENDDYTFTNFSIY